jgi:hypothetical protein
VSRVDERGAITPRAANITRSCWRMSSITQPDTPTQSISEARRYWHGAARAPFTLRGRLDPGEVGGRAGRRCAADATRPGRSDRRGREPDRDAGLTVTIRLPAAPTGRALSVLSYGATPGRNSDDRLESAGVFAVGAARKRQRRITTATRSHAPLTLTLVSITRLRVVLLALVRPMPRG